MDTIETGQARFGVYARQPTPSLQALADVKAIAAHALAEENADGLRRRLPADLIDLYQQAHGTWAPAGSRLPHTARTSPGRMAPSHAVVAAAGVLAAVEVLGRPSVSSAAEALRWLTAEARARGQTMTPTYAASWGHETSIILDGVALSSLQPAMRATDQLRYRTGSPCPSFPEDGRIMVLARSTPTMLWPLWALRLAPPGYAARVVRAALSVLVLLPGTRATTKEAMAMLGNAIDRTSIRIRIIQVLQETPEWRQVLTALTRLSDYLAAQQVPVDYQRRRALHYADLLPSAEWQRICGVTGATPGTGYKESLARAYLTQRVSGLPCSTPPPDMTASVSAYRTGLSLFPASLFPELSTQLDGAARSFLARQGITGEPVAWQPPISLIGDLDLPGTDPAAVNIVDLHQLINEGKSPATAARILATTTETVCAVLAEHPAPARPIISGQGSMGGGPRIRASAAKMPKGELERLYVLEGMTARQIAASHHMWERQVAILLRRYDIPVQRRQPKGVAPRAGFTQDWLRREYVDKGRSFSELAAEADCSPSALAAWARKWGVPIRPRGTAGNQAAARARLAAAAEKNP
jgi:hypothetical protein